MIVLFSTDKKHLLENVHDIGVVGVDDNVHFIDYRVFLEPLLVSNEKLNLIFGLEKNADLFLNYDFVYKLHQVDPLIWKLQDRMFVVTEKRELESTSRDLSWKKNQYKEETNFSRSCICSIKLESQPILVADEYVGKWNGKTVRKIISRESRHSHFRLGLGYLDGPYFDKHYFIYEDNSYTVVYVSEFVVQDVVYFEPFADEKTFLESLEVEHGDDLDGVFVDRVQEVDLKALKENDTQKYNWERLNSFSYLIEEQGEMKVENADAFMRLVDLLESL